ncbi:MAG TPA: MFS transporter [Burkholderiales bacterium]|nr:MFS transporter [Burkholderiales bacterium]
MTAGTGIREAIFGALQRRAFYGWTILAVAGLGIFASGPGQSHTFSVFVGPIGRDLGLSKAAIASAYGLATLAAAFLLPKMGRLVDRHGSRRMTVVVALLLGVACALFGAASGLITLAVGFALLRFFGQGSLMMNCATLVAQWFSRRRGFAMGLMALGFATSMAVHPPLGQYLINQLGWRWAWVVLGLMTWVILLPPVLLLVYDKPEDKGLAPDGEAAPADGAPAAAIDGLTLREALATPTFYLVSAGWFGMAMLVTTLHFYQVSILTAQGLAAATAARVFPVSALVMVLTMPMVGRMFDRLRTRYVFAAGLLVQAGALVGVTLVADTASAIAYAAWFGLNNAFSMTMFGYLMPRFFGRKHLGSLQGTGQMVAVVGASLGPLPVGLAFDLLGSPTLTLRLLALYPLACAVLAALWLRTPAGVTHPSHLE